MTINGSSPNLPDLSHIIQDLSGRLNNIIAARGGYYGSGLGTYHDGSSSSSDYRGFGYYHHHGQPNFPDYGSSNTVVNIKPSELSNLLHERESGNGKFRHSTGTSRCFE
ncbi:hypothetical protein LguiB_032564 [Lonicera macranthoides]